MASQRGITNVFDGHIIKRKSSTEIYNNWTNNSSTVDFIMP